MSSQWAFADLSEMIVQNSGKIAVITQTPGSFTDSGYGLLTMPPGEFAQQLGLKDPSLLENDYFKIVDDTSLDALSTADFDGDNALYHLMQARAFYSNLAKMSGNDAALSHKIIVRVRVKEAYNPIKHFSDYEGVDNAGYYPRSYNGKYGSEIWFNPKKSLFQKLNTYDVAVNTGFSIISKSWEQLAITFPLTLYQHYNAGMDAVKMPSVIYHEAFHYATDAAGLFPMASCGNPVAEDYANYFGSSFLGKPQIADIDEFSSRVYKRNYNSIKPVKDTRSVPYNSIPFGPSVFWQIRKWLGQDRADQLIWNSLQYLNGSFKETAVPDAVLSAVQASKNISESESAEISALFSKYRSSYVNLDIKFGAIPIEKNETPADLAQLIQQVDDKSLQESATAQADQIRKISADLNAKGLILTADEEKTLEDAATELEGESRKPTFKQKIMGVMKKVGHGFERAGLDVVKTVAYVGDGIYAVTNAPLAFGTDFTTGLIWGQGKLSQRKMGTASDITAAAGGIGSFYYAYVGLDAIGGEAVAPITDSTLVVVIVNELLCTGHDPQGTTGMDRYCAENAKIIQVISMDSAKAGAFLGENIRKVFAKKHPQPPVNPLYQP